MHKSVQATRIMHVHQWNTFLPCAYWILSRGACIQLQLVFPSLPFLSHVLCDKNLHSVQEHIHRDLILK